ncbi:MAG: 2-oxoacid:acceptor oxidoreductase family protein [Pyramidobacter sp.]|nr:2-oxoacid:acceptor oxidoreductase family protein [Pyramidobacter sp.]
MFYKELIAAGFGGQGVMVLGQLVAYGGIEDGRNVTWIPSYGPEMRGGTANCSTVVSDEPVGSPVISMCDVAVILNQPSLEKFESAPRKGGVLIYNSDLVKYDNPRTDVKVIAIPAQKIAAEIGSEKVANVVLFGAVVESSGIISKESAVHVVEEKLGKKKPQFLPMNLKALEKGMEFARA